MANEKGELENSTLLAPETINGAVSPSPSTSSFVSTETSESEFTSSWEKLQDVYSRNIGLFYVLLAQLFASIVRTYSRVYKTSADKDRCP
jgi:hypothetical protein